MRSVRIFFNKEGLTKYISHLDLIRLFSRAVKRAKIDIWYTEGYNPRPYMNFSLPLSLGTESRCETLDIRTNDEMPFEEIMKRLNETLPEGITVTNVSAPVHKPEEIAFADYRFLFYTAEPDAVAEKLKNVLSSGEIMVEKKAKQGRKRILKEVNIRDNIIDYTLSEKPDCVILSARLCAGMRNNTNTTLLTGALTKDIGDKILRQCTVKEKMYLENLEEFT